MKTIYMENGVIMYYGSRVGQIADGCAVVDPLFQGPELQDFLDKQKHIREVKWMDGIYDRLMNAPKEAGFRQAALKNVRIWQLKPDVDIQMKFIPFDELSHRFGPPELSNYEAVYDGAADTNDLEALYLKFRDQKPPGFTGYPMSISDVIELYDSRDSSFYYVDRRGFRQIEAIQPLQEPIHTHNMQL